MQRNWIGRSEGAEIDFAVEEIAERLGFDGREVELIGDLVRWHLLLPETATTRDPDDPATVEVVTDKVGDREELELLAVLTEADARATSEKAWTKWRASLVRTLVRRAAAVLADEPVPDDPATEIEIPERLQQDHTAISVVATPSGDGSRVTVVTADRVGLLADAAAMLALQKVSVRAARAWTQDGFGVSVWDVAETGLDDILLRQRLEAIVDGRIDAAERLSRVTPVKLEPTVAVRPDVSPRATVPRGALGRPAGTDPRVCAGPWPGWTSPFAPRTSPHSDPRPSTCSTSRRAPPARCRRNGPRRPPMPSARPWSRPSRRADRSGRPGPVLRDAAEPTGAATLDH